MPRLPAILLVDNYSLDNPAAAIALTSSASIFQTVMVMVAPRPVHSSPKAALHEFEPELTAERHRLNTGRMAGMLARAGRKVAVFQGLSVPETYWRDMPLITTIPHAKHGDERKYDLWNDGNYPIAGNFEDGLEYLVRFWQEHRTPVKVIVGGPFTDLAALMEDRRLKGAFDLLTAQGSFGASNSTIFGKESFNIAVAREAAYRVWESYERAMYMVPSDITRAPEVSFESADDMASTGVMPDLVAAYRVHQQETRQSRLSIHDVHPVFLMHQLVRSGSVPYTWQRVEDLDSRERFVVTNQAHKLHRVLVRYFLSS